MKGRAALFHAALDVFCARVWCQAVQTLNLALCICTHSPTIVQLLLLQFLQPCLVMLCDVQRLLGSWVSLGPFCVLVI